MYDCFFPQRPEPSKVCLQGCLSCQKSSGNPRSNRFFLMTHSAHPKEVGKFELEKVSWSHFWKMLGSFVWGGFGVTLDSFVFLFLIYYVFPRETRSLFFFQKLLVNVLWDRTGFLSCSRIFTYASLFSVVAGDLGFA